MIYLRSIFKTYEADVESRLQCQQCLLSKLSLSRHIQSDYT